MTMPRYGMPGATTDRRTALRRGTAVVIATTVLCAAAIGYQHTRSGDGFRVHLVTTRVGAGVVTGSPVELHGVTVGSVERIEATAPGRQRITVVLRPTAATDLTDTLAIDYAPANLFGISEIALHPGTGGTALRNGGTVELTGPGRAADATMGRLLERLALTAGQTLTPELTDTLRRVAAEIGALAPILQAIVQVTRIVADTQRYPSSYLLEQYASALPGLGSLLGGSVTLLDDLARIPVLRNDRALFDHAVDVITDDILPAASRTGRTAQHQFGGYADLLAPLLQAVAATVPDPRRSGGELRRLLDNADSAFTDSANGPVLNLEVVLRGVPAVAVPLLGGGGGR
ncbi:MCE family protein [Nocardia terpenica]|nr:MCE family protein [Nocardia terpenica]